MWIRVKLCTGMAFFGPPLLSYKFFVKGAGMKSVTFSKAILLAPAGQVGRVAAAAPAKGAPAPRDEVQEAVDALNSKLGTLKHRVIPGRHPANGIVERVNQQAIRMLRACILDHRRLASPCSARPTSSGCVTPLRVG